MGIYYQVDSTCDIQIVPSGDYEDALTEVYFSSEDAIYTFSEQQKDPHWYVTGCEEGTVYVDFLIYAKDTGLGYKNFYDTSLNRLKITVVPSTGISDVNYEKNDNARVYDIQGYLKHRPQKGINIINGKKVLVK